MTLLLQKVQHRLLGKSGISLSIARADLIHPLASGNKIYKLMPNLDFAKSNNYSELLSFGGAFSNHIHALALMAEKNGLKSIGIIRGEEAYRDNPTLQDAQNAGMHLEFISRQNYKRRNDDDYLQALQQRYPEALIIPEGGSSQYAIGGCAQLAKEINEIQQSDILGVACGTGATVAGLVCGSSKNQKVIGYAVLCDESLQKRVEAYIHAENHCSKNLKIETADFGGYAKLDKLLLDFILDWLEQTEILLDPIYTSKMCMKLMQQTESGEFKAGTSITMVHSGGLQGWRGMKSRVIKLVGDEKWQKIEKHL
jgi:1-aminocyclopropane-1-carboxylate deaminase/D-cysteine desulfhydrase-like pyridoxal-dependent ACC family enzyme